MNKQIMPFLKRGLGAAVFLVFLPVPWTSAQTAAAPAVKVPQVRIQSHAMKNGLRVLMVEDHSTPVINLQVWYHVGSKDERSGRTGFAHLFEHLMFKGSAHVAPDEHSRIIEAMGGVDNAYTNDDVTVYWQTFPSNRLERVIWLEADRLGSLNVDETNFKSEREVVKEERRVGVEDPPYGRVVEDLYAAAFTVHPYKHTTIGSMEDLNNATIEDVRAFHRTYYRPDNATMVVVGDFRPADAIGWSEKYLGGIPRPKDPVPRVEVQEPEQTAERRVSKWYGDKSPLPGVIQAYQMPAQYAPDSYALNLAANVLSGGESSRLYQELVYKQRIAMQSAGFGNFTEDPNLFWAFAIMNVGKDAAEGEKAVQTVLEALKTQGVIGKELEKARNQVISNFILGRQSVQQKADALGRYAVIGKDPNLINTELARFLAVTAADVQGVAQRYFVSSRRTVISVEPPKK